jgi:hypothetical protein
MTLENNRYAAIVILGFVKAQSPQKDKEGFSVNKKC